MKRVAILQSNYIPWKGYFDLMAAVDEFILYDDVQYTCNDWRNRNQIKTPQGVQWLTVPVRVSGRFEQSIREAEIDGTRWAIKHWKSLRLNYERAPYFAKYSAQLEALYLGANYTHLSVLNEALLLWVKVQLDIPTRIRRCSEYRSEGSRNERLVDLCRQAGADEYVSGPAARSYLDEGLFAQAGIKVCWFEYPAYAEYPQLWGTFAHGVSVLDVLFNCGPDAARYALPSRRQPTLA